MTPDCPETLLEAVRYFADLTVCNRYMRQLKWPDGKVTCPKCGADKIGEVATRHLLRCKACRKQFSYKVDTIFEDSPLGLDKWFVAIWCIANAKNGISSHELGRALGVTQKTAWFMLHRIRLAMHTGTFRKLTGEVEADETFIGGKADNMHKSKREKAIKGRGAVGKAIVHGLLERGGEVKATVIANTDAKTIRPLITQHVDPSAKLYTDAHAAYGQLDWRYVREFIDHATKYVEGRVHINGIENFWSLLKRTLKGTYVSVAPFHLKQYLAEQTFRYNRRKTNDANRFWGVLKSVVGRRVTYRILTAQDDAGFMTIK